MSAPGFISFACPEAEKSDIIALIEILLTVDAVIKLSLCTAIRLIATFKEV